MDELRLATSRFHAREVVQRSGLVPVGIVVSPPRWALGYQLAGNVTLLAPVGLLDVEAAEEFAARYRERLEAVGVAPIERILRGFAEAFDAPGCVLLCYENLEKPGEWCHRRVFAEWWQERTGAEVPELHPPFRQSVLG